VPVITVPRFWQPTDTDVPETVRRAAAFMFAGACVTVVQAIVAMAFLVRGKGIPAQITGYTLQAVVFAGLWYLMARFTQLGKGWARIVSSVLFAYNTLTMASFLRFGISHDAAGVVIFSTDVVMWAIGAGAVYWLWVKESMAYFKRPAAGDTVPPQRGSRPDGKPKVTRSAR
jgi:hypothetical protein